MDFTKMTREEAIKLGEEVVSDEKLQKLIPIKIIQAIKVLLETIENQSKIISLSKEEDMGF